LSVGASRVAARLSLPYPLNWLWSVFRPIYDALVRAGAFVYDVLHLVVLVNYAREFGIPLGGILVGIFFGVLIYATVASLRRRPSTEGAGVVRITVYTTPPPEPGPAPAGTTPPPAPPKVAIYGKDAVRTVWMKGAGEHPTVPIPRARWFVLTLLISFIVFAVLILKYYSFLFGHYDHVVGIVGQIIYWPIVWPGVYAVSVSRLIVPDYIFPMYLAGMAAFAIASGLVFRRPALPTRRRLLALVVVIVYVLAMLVVDAIFFTVPGIVFRDFALIVRAFTGGVFMALLTFCAITLPIPQRIRPRFPRDRGAIARFLGVALTAVVISVIFLSVLNSVLHLAGLVFAFTILLLLPLMSFELFALIGRPLYFRDLKRESLPPVSVYHPSVSILIPAYNEEEWIGEAIAHADYAAGLYPGSTEIVVGNDGSTDRTLELARAAIAKLEHAKGYVVDLPHGGKSNALNGALAVARGEIVIRADGDTYISKTTGFSALIPHFANPQVGAVQGAIHPRQRRGWTRKLRALEVAWMHYFMRPAGMATRSAEVVDGLFSAFRRAELSAVGGWVPWNGEDTEISIRMQRYGYKIRIEFGAIALEDVPRDYNSLRRQRVRWARGILMANGQHYRSLTGPTPEFAGLGVLFWLMMYIRSGVRSLVYVFLVLLIVILGIPALVDTAYLLLFAILMRAIPISYFLVKMKRPDIIAWVWFFPFANVIKQNFRFEAYGLLGPSAQAEYI
jgi:cellulose synthase/poly-beta-1,6-N-acetylglucosamine synthase-like glycosyltransferase